MVVGFHTQEPFKRDDRLTMATISGFKVFHRPADVVLTFQRMSGNYSRIVWVKNRSAQLHVGADEEWSLLWRRGYGFERVEMTSAESHVPGVFS